MHTHTRTHTHDPAALEQKLLKTEQDHAIERRQFVTQIEALQTKLALLSNQLARCAGRNSPRIVESPPLLFFSAVASDFRIAGSILDRSRNNPAAPRASISRIQSCMRAG